MSQTTAFAIRRQGLYSLILPDQQTTSVGRLAAALLIALVGCVLIWVAVPYNNFLLDNSYLADSFLPEAVVALLLLVVLLLNPLLRLLGKGWMLDRWQVALIGSVLLFAAIIPSNGLMRMFPRFVAEINQSLNENVSASRIAADAKIPQKLFPDPLPKRGPDGSVQISDTPVSSQFLNELSEGNRLPWSSWYGPLVAWGALMMAIWAMMLGLGGIVFPQWRDRERLPFPLLNVYQSFLGDPDEAEGRVLPVVFSSRGFWIAAFVVFFLHGLRGLNTFTHSVPFFPLEWNLTDYFADTFLRDTTLALKRQSILFTIVGVGYFIPNRYAISVWGWVVAYSLYVTFGRAYIPAFNEGQVNDQSFGVLVAIVLWTLWLGRAHWFKVGRAMFARTAGGSESRRDAIAGWVFVMGCAGMVCWLKWVGCSLWWSLMATGGAAMVALMMARIIAETGIPILWLGRFSIQGLTLLFPMTWLSPNILLFNSVFYSLITRSSAVSAAVIATLALGMDRKATPKQHSRLMLGGLAVLAIGFVVCGAVHLHMGYHNPGLKTQAKVDGTVIANWEHVDRASYSFFNEGRAHQGVGFGMGAVLLWACSRFPSWFVHPVGILFCQISIGNLLWFSIFLGWLLKVTVTSLFGGGAYRKARPIFLGLILGELMAVIVWAMVPVVIVLITKQDPAEVARYMIFQYP